MNISTCTNGNRNYQTGNGHLDDAATGKDHGAHGTFSYSFFASPIIIRLQSGSRQGTAIRTCKLLTCNSSATRTSLTVIIFRKFQLSSKSLIMTCQDATNTRPDAFTSKHVCEEGGDDKKRAQTRPELVVLGHRY